MITQKNFWFFFGGTWFGIGAVFAVVGAGILWHEWTLDGEIARNGETVPGVVLAKSITARKNQDPTFRVEYRYTAAGGTVNEGAAEVDGRTWDALTEGGPIAVTYVRDHPRSHRLPGQTGHRFLVSMLGGIGLLLAISGAVILWRARKQRTPGAGKR